MVKWLRYNLADEVNFDESPPHRKIVSIGVFNYFCMVGFLVNFLTRADDETVPWVGFVWDFWTDVFAGGLIGGSVVAFFLTRYYEDPQLRWGARIFICALPLALPAFLTFGLVDVRLKGIG